MAVAASDLPWQELDHNLRAFIARRVRNQADVDDLVQRVLLQIDKGLGTLRDAGRLHAWMYRTARNVIVDYYRSAGRTRELDAGGTRTSSPRMRLHRALRSTTTKTRRFESWPRASRRCSTNCRRCTRRPCGSSTCRA